MRVLVVCTGNICRSPVIEMVLRDRLPDLDVSSAGTQAMAGRPVHMLTATAVAEAGLAVPDHRSRLLGPAVLAGVDLVVTAERAQRAAVLAVRPELLRRTLTFHELVSLAEAVRPGLPAGGPEEALRAVVARRGRHPVSTEDLPDPVDAGPEEHHQMVRSVVTMTDRLVAALRPAGGPPADGPVTRA